MFQALMTTATASQGCDARELHSVLGVDARFNDWVGRRIAEYGFVEGEDFYSDLSRSTGGRPSDEYTLTLDMAKELAMVERSKIGRKVRKYFIACEKELVARKKQDLLEERRRASNEVAIAYKQAAEYANKYSAMKAMRTGFFPGRRLNIMSMFEEDTCEDLPGGKIVMTGYMFDRSIPTYVMCHENRVFMDAYTLSHFAGITVPQVKKLTVPRERRQYEGRLLFDLDRMPEPLIIE